MAPLRNQSTLISSILNKLIFIISFLLLAVLLSWFSISDSCYDAGGKVVGFGCEGADFDFIPLWRRLDAWPYWIILIILSIVGAASITKILDSIRKLIQLMGH